MFQEDFKEEIRQRRGKMIEIKTEREELIE